MKNKSKSQETTPVAMIVDENKPQIVDVFKSTIKTTPDGKHVIINVGKVGDKQVGQIQLPKTDKPNILTSIDGVGRILIRVIKVKSDKPGRPINPDSERQQKLLERETRGNVGRGRPANPDSESYQKKQERLAKIENMKAGLRVEHPDWDETQIEEAVVLKRGRQPLEGSERQSTIAERLSKYKELIDAKRSENQALYQGLSDEQMLKHIVMPKGRPKGNGDMVEIESTNVVIIGSEIDAETLVG